MCTFTVEQYLYNFEDRLDELISQGYSMEEIDQAIEAVEALIRD